MAQAMTAHRLEQLQALFSDSQWFKADEGQELLDEIERAWGEIGAAHDVIFANYPQAVAPLAAQARAFVAPFAAEPHDEAGHLAETTCRACYAEAMLAEIEGAEAECRLAEKRRPGLTEEVDAMLDAYGAPEDGVLSLAGRVRRAIEWAVAQHVPPPLTEEQAREMVRTEFGDIWADDNPVVFAVFCALLLRASRGETGPAKPGGAQ